MKVNGVYVVNHLAQRIKVTDNGGSLRPASDAFTLKNTVSEINSIEDLGDVSQVAVANGATLIYNGDNHAYEVKALTQDNISGDIILDGGEF